MFKLQCAWFFQSNISLILHAVGEYELSLRFLEHALALNLRYHGSRSLKVAVSYHLVARTQSCMGDFRAALNNEKETYAIYKQQLGEEHEKTKESSDCLRHLTQQAVVLQKKMNEIYTGKSGVSLPPIQVQPPSMGSVLDMLNVINGILFVQISQQDIDNFKAEIEKRQKEQTQLDGSETIKIEKDVKKDDKEIKKISSTMEKKVEKIEQKEEVKKLETSKGSNLEPVVAAESWTLCLSTTNASSLSFLFFWALVPLLVETISREDCYAYGIYTGYIMYIHRIYIWYLHCFDISFK